MPTDNPLIAGAIKDINELSERAFDAGVVTSVHQLLVEGHEDAARYLLSCKDSLMQKFRDGVKKE